jgi:hypothetical protein
MTGKPRLLATVVGALATCLLIGPGAAPLGANGPGPQSTKRMKMRFTPKRGPAGTTFRGVARGFARGEPVAVHELRRGRRTSRLPGGSASPTGRVRVLRRTFATSKPGPRKLCLRGERSRRVACGGYFVTRGVAREEESPGLEEEEQPHQDTGGEGDLLEPGDGGLPDLGEALDPLENG